MVKLIITEKPSVATDIAKTLGIKNKKDGYIEGNGYIISWAVGHLVELAEPENYDESYKKWDITQLPIIPTQFKLQTKKETYKQYLTLKNLLNSPEVSEVICATDAGREGQLIFGWIYQLSKCKKPVKRLWISSYTEQAIKKGFDSLKDNKEYESLFESAQARAQADWLFGINATRAISCINNEMYSIGRVQTPTLALIVNRQNEIDNFVPVPYFQVQGVFRGVNFLYKNKDNESNFEKKEDAEAILKAVDGKPGKVVKVEVAKKTEDRPQLYDLTDLQREANMKYGFTAQQTLDAAQSLYERHKLITYPRTDSKYVGDDIASDIKKILGYIGLGWVESQPVIKEAIAAGLKIDKRIVDATKVTDHHAIIPTEKAAEYSKMTLNDFEDKIYKLIATRFIAAVSQKYEYMETTVAIDVDGHMFYATYKKPEKYGWKNVYKKLLNSTKKDENIEVIFNKGEIVNADKYEVLEKMTTPPKPYTEASLLSAMENISKKVDGELKQYISNGLGTPATRAGIIERLKQVKYIEMKGKTIVPTQKGKNLISIAPEKLKQPELTAEWEERLENIRNKKETLNNFMEGIKEHLKATIKDIIGNSVQYKISSEGSGYSGKKNPDGSSGAEEIGKCPKCGMPVYENSKAFSCSGYKNNPKCDFAIWKENKWFKAIGKKITKTMVKNFLTKGECLVKEIKKKDGSGTYDAVIVMDATSSKWVSFSFKQKNK